MKPVIATTYTERYKTIVQTDAKQLIVDEPEELGGKDLGFTPSELLAGALASCTSITLRMYVERKGWEVPSLSVSVTFDRNPETSHSTFERTIEVEGTLDDKQKNRLIAIANACPMHKTLSGTIEINTRLGNPWSKSQV